LLCDKHSPAPVSTASPLSTALLTPCSYGEQDFLSQREAIKHLPPKVILFEELLSEHVHNVEEIISRYSETEAELDYLRMKMQDKIIQKKAEMEQKVDQQEIEELAEVEGASSHSFRHLTFKNLFPKDKAKTRDRYSRELAEIKELEQLILNKSGYLKDLLAATEFLRSDHFEEKVKALRLKYKQLEFIKDESYVLRSALDEVETQVGCSSRPDPAAVASRLASRIAVFVPVLQLF
jgi:hypothetical protein